MQLGPTADLYVVPRLTGPYCRGVAHSSGADVPSRSVRYYGRIATSGINLVSERLTTGWSRRLTSRSHSGSLGVHRPTKQLTSQREEVRATRALTCFEKELTWSECSSRFRTIRLPFRTH
jgi:hypothetical protein